MQIKFNNHPDLRRLFLDDTWGFPLRKDYVDDVGLHEIYNKVVEENQTELKTDTQIKFEKKADQLIKYFYDAFTDSIKKVDDLNFIQFNSNLIKVCRGFCLDTNNLTKFNVSNDEKTCMKNCSSKYVLSHKSYNFIESDLIQMYGPYIFVHSVSEKENMKKLYNMIEKERIDKFNF